VLTFENGDVYDGEFCQNAQHGQGRMQYKVRWRAFANPVRLRGKRGRCCLANAQTWTSSSRDLLCCARALTRVDMTQGGGYYKGEWEANQRSGDGLLVSEQGDRYAGYFVSGLRDGFGHQTYGNLESYEGRWKQDTYEGWGRYLSPQRFELYEGDFSGGHRHGQGQLEVRGKLRYKGTWKHGAMQGTGEFHAEDGSIYRGNFEDNRMHGEGKLTAHRADHAWSFEGEFKDNKRSAPEMWSRGQCELWIKVI